jgi:hypothetical protein
MRLNIFLFIFLALISFSNTLQAQNDEDVEKVGDIFDNVLTKSSAYNWLHYLCKNIGHRIAGSPAGAAAVEFTRQMLDTMGCDKVWLQAVKVPYWTRGNISECRIINSQIAGDINLSACALGYSAATDIAGISAEVIEVKSVSELEKMDAAKVKGKIVFFNAAMDPTKVSTFSAYGEAGHQRTAGPRKAAEKGAVGALVRSLTLKADDIPHSGVTIFDEIQPIPALGLGIQSAERLSALLSKEKQLKVYIRLDCKKHKDQLTYNVIGEIKGTEFPDKIILVGGHIDSWDLGEGAHDEGAGCVENGLKGGSTYADEAKNKGEIHVAAIESDGGGHTPRGFGMDAVPEILKDAYAKTQKFREILAPYGFYELVTGGSGADIGPLKNQNVVLFGYRPDSQRYFDFHHTVNDVFESVHKRELELGAAGITSLVYLIDKYGY